MTKSIAVATAVTDQLCAEHWPTDDPEKVMSTDFHYDLYSISNFLNCVRCKLRPTYDFEFDGDFARDALGWSVGTLTGHIESQTH